EIVIASDDNTIRRPDKSSDTYSFGSITLQALSGHIPYHHLRSDVCVILHLSKGIKPPRRSASDKRRNLGVDPELLG
ncbi:hypothetical protein BD779DRAFT_1768003, partial [Infundibulicybe gibba]